MSNYKCCDIVLAKVFYTGDITNYKVRPFIIARRDGNTYAGFRVTSNLDAHSSCCYYLKGWRTSGLVKPSLVDLSNLYIMNAVNIHRKLGVASTGDRKEFIAMSYDNYDDMGIVDQTKLEGMKMKIKKLLNEAEAPNAHSLVIEGDKLTKASHSVTTVNIPDNITSIGEYAFDECVSLTSITIPTDVTSMGYMAFFGCHNLTNVYYKGTIDQWIRIRFKSEISNPLYYAKNLYINNELVTEANLTRAAKINRFAFCGYRSLKSITIPDGVKTIGTGAFYNCSGLTSVVIPESVTSISYNAFDGCRELKKVIIKNANVRIAPSAFLNCSEDLKITVGGRPYVVESMERNKELQEACQQAKIRYMSKKLREDWTPDWAIWVKNSKGEWKPWGARTEFPTEKELAEMKDWLFDRGYVDITVLKNNGSRPVVGIYESFEDEHVGKEVEELEKTPNPPDSTKGFGIANILSSLIQDEWQAIDGYNSAIVSLAEMHFDEDILNVFKDIVAEEHTHIGQLQKALEEVSPNASAIQQGETEGEEQIDSPNTVKVDIK